MISSLVEEVMIEVIDESIPDPKEFIKALPLWPVIAVSPEVPLSKKGGPVPFPFKYFCHGQFLQGHVSTFRAIHISLSPVVHSAPLGMSPGHHHRPRWTAYRMSIGLSKPHSSFG
jgi:hypothetical protein